MKKTYEIVVEGVVSQTFVIVAEDVVTASEVARRDFAKDNGSDYLGLNVVDIFQITPPESSIQEKIRVARQAGVIS